MKLSFALCALPGLLALCTCTTNKSPPTVAPPIPSATAIDAAVGRAMAVSRANGLAVAVIANGQPIYGKSFGARNAAGDPLQNNTIMYGASLTKAVFAFTVMQLVDEGVIDLDVPIERYLAKPLPAYVETQVEDLYARWSDLAGDDR